MPAPSTTLEWATDANYPAGSDAWSGTPTGVEPSSGEKGTGFVPAERPPAQFFNWFMHLAGLWVQWLAAERDRIVPFIGGAAGTSEWAYDAPRARTIWIPPSALIIAGSNMTRGGSSLPSSNPGVVRKNVDGSIGTAFLNLNRYVPANATITRIRAPVIFDDSGTVPTLEMSLQVFGVDMANWVASGATHYDGETVLDSLSGSDPTARYVMDSGVISVGGLADNGNPGGRELRFEITGVDQEIFGVEVQFTDAGVKNV